MTKEFSLESEYKPTGDQVDAIAQLTEGVLRGEESQTLLGVTGSGKTFTIANVINNVNRPTLVLSHNKTLAAQLYSEFKAFFPNNAVEYYVSYYDYYQPEAYLPNTDTYIEKDLAINEEIDRLRLSAIQSLLSGRRDVIVVSSVSCIYGIGNPEDFTQNTIELNVGQKVNRDELLRRLVRAMYVRNDIEFQRGTFRVKGDTLDIWLAFTDAIIRIIFWDNEIDSIELLDCFTLDTIETLNNYRIAPANIFASTKENTERAIREIELDLGKEVEKMNSYGKEYEARRLYERTTYDLEMMREIGYCAGIENYSRYFDGREPGTPPFCLMDFFPKDFLMVIDESHVSIPQIKAMYGGDHSRKNILVEYGFRMESAKDNRPLKFEEFESKKKQTIFVSATPEEYELEKSGGVVVEQVIRPTGLLDPEIIVKPSKNQIDDLLEEIAQRAENDERVLVTTLTKRMAEELTDFLLKNGVRATYIHSDIDTLERMQILNDLRAGIYDVLVGVNLLREGLDLPQVSLVAILDADKEGFLRSHRSLTQTAGRAARNVNGKVIMYADTITRSMQMTIDETNRRRAKQKAYNEANGIIPTSAFSNGASPLAATSSQPESPINRINVQAEYRQTCLYVEAKPLITSEASNHHLIAAETASEYKTKEELQKEIDKLKKCMLDAAKKQEFLQAAQYRDEMLKLMKLL